MSTENNALQVKERSIDLIAIMTEAETSRDYERSLTMQKIITSAIPMAELRRVVGSRQVAIALDVQLTRLVGNLNLKWSLNDGQIKTIVEDLLDKYPNESLEDFILCFKKARQGEFGELIRLDGPIIFSWMDIYLDEKYKAVEDKLMKEKEDHYKLIIPENTERDWHKEWLGAINKNDGMKAVPQLSEEEIKDEGQEKPKRQAYPYNESEAEIRLREMHERLWQFQEQTVRERHPDWTEDQVKARLKELKETILYEEQKPKHTFGIAKIWAKKKKKSA